MDFFAWIFHRKMLLVCAVTFALGSLTTAGVLTTLGTTTETCVTEHDLLNPAVPCNNALQQGEWNYEPLRDQLSQMKDTFKESGQLSHLSIYFRDLIHGPRFGIGEYDKFHPASLTKVPVMIALLHEADLDPNILEKSLSFSGSLGVTENVERSEETIQEHTPYTVRELMEKMIMYSDNNSYKLLMREMNTSPAVIAYYTFRDLDVLHMMLAPNADYISIQSYGNLFGILYNTGYLSKETSQFALELLTHTTFDEGLVAGTPEGTVVAHKFGRRILETEDDQLHDCGIVYHPQLAYVLCVMTSGPEYEDQKAAIADVSRTVYEEVSTLHL